MSVRITQDGTPRPAHSGLGRSHHRVPGPCHSVPGASRVQSRDPRVNPNPPEVSPMTITSLAPKIRPDHLDRLALVYVRQSTLIQVRENTASTARQYDLAGRAATWDGPGADPGHRSGSGTLGGLRGRPRRLPAPVAQVGLGQAGAVLSLEASRLARSCSDWYRLIEICALTNTLVIDEDGVYDPTQYSDRLLLGFLGTMSEAELHWLRSRLLGGKLEKARVANSGSGRPPGWSTTRRAGSSSIPTNRSSRQSG